NVLRIDPHTIRFIGKGQIVDINSKHLLEYDDDLYESAETIPYSLQNYCSNDE
ncbi:unnamed protein product, partial [Rotaria sp. Silwood1]